eukprot:1649888-Pyramimonas_sp.AAC.1
MLPLLPDEAPRDLELFFSKVGLLSLMRGIQGGRAPGPDGFPPDLLKLAPLELVEIIRPLLAKVTMTTREPLAFKDGR